MRTRSESNSTSAIPTEAPNTEEKTNNKDATLDEEKEDANRLPLIGKSRSFSAAFGPCNIFSVSNFCDIFRRAEISELLIVFIRLEQGQKYKEKDI